MIVEKTTIVNVPTHETAVKLATELIAQGALFSATKTEHGGVQFLVTPASELVDGKTITERCLERHGYTNPTPLTCPVGCGGDLADDGVNGYRTLRFVVCRTCGCTHTIAITAVTP